MRASQELGSSPDTTTPGTTSEIEFMRVVIIVVAFCLISAMVIAFLAGSVGSGPMYQGRSAGQWIHIWCSGHATKAELDDAERAIRAMGTNVIPYALKLITKDYPKLLTPVYGGGEGSGYAILEILGTNAWPAAPALIELTKHPGPTVRNEALGALLDMGLEKETIIPVMVSMSHDPVPWVRSVSTGKFLERYPEEAKSYGFTWEALDAENFKRSLPAAVAVDARASMPRAPAPGPDGALAVTAPVPTAYRQEVLRLLTSEATRVASQLALPEKLPITEADLVGAYVPPPSLARFIGALGSIGTTNYTYYVSVANKFSFLERAGVQGENRRLLRECLWPISRMDTNAAHSLATQLLAQASMDVRAIERDCRVTVLPWTPERGHGEMFVPLYWVYWVRPGEDRPVASVALVLPTRSLQQLRVSRAEYILRPPLVVTNLELPLLQTNAPNN